MINIRIARVFEGWRHERLRAIWDTVAEYHKSWMRLCWYPVPAGDSHADAFDAMWDIEKNTSNNVFSIMTEADFLPYVDNIKPYIKEMAQLCLKEKYGALGYEYLTRHPKTRALMSHDQKTAGWFLLLNRKECPKFLTFQGVPDPCNQLQDHMRVGHDTDVHDMYPETPSLDYESGIHLFWSRHLHDDPTRKVAGFLLGDIQDSHDLAVDNWIAEQPQDYQDLLDLRCPGIDKAKTWKHRNPSATSASCSAATAASSTSPES